MSWKSCPKSISSEPVLFVWLVIYYELNICFKILSVIKYVGFTPVVPKPPDAKVLPVSVDYPRHNTHI